MENKALVSMISIDGGLRHMPEYLVPELQKKGWKIIVNPKRNYYPELDQTSPYYKKEEKDSNDSNMLEVEIL